MRSRELARTPPPPPLSRRQLGALAEALGLRAHQPGPYMYSAYSTYTKVHTQYRPCLRVQNISNWIESYAAVGVQSVILTAKHGCGFLLWPTNVTLPDGPSCSHIRRTKRLPQVLLS